MWRQDRILALVLILVCVMAALGNWLGSLPAAAPQRPGLDGTSRPADVALIPINGVITFAGESSPLGGGTTLGAQAILRAIRRAQRDKVKAILVSINSPGGSAAASQAIYRELMRARQKGFKVVATMGEVAASGGYYVAAAADHIVANPSTVTGSIGVILQVQNLTDLLKKIGVQTVTIKSGPFKDIASPLRPTTPSEMALLKDFVNQSYQQFVEAILQGRKGKISREELVRVADGRILIGSAALKAKLVDSLGNYYDALEQVKTLTGLKTDPVVRNYLAPDWRESLQQLFRFGLERWLPQQQWRELAQWNKVPLALME